MPAGRAHISRKDIEELLAPLMLEIHSDVGRPRSARG